MRRLLLLLLLVPAAVPASASAIVGGTAAPAQKYPAVANVTIDDAFGCTGTLIARDWVLTAGHCSSLTGSTGIATPLASPPSSFAVVVGTVQRSGAGGERLAVDRVVVPGSYLLTQGYDTSLLHLSKPATTAPTPIAGKGYAPLYAAGVLTEVVGFGVTTDGGDPPATLQEVDLPVVPDASCAATYGSFEPATQLCAGYDEGGKDACQGDSGGPMFSRTTTGRLLLVGATSYGDGCAKPKTPGVYARVSDATLREFVRTNAPAGVVDAGPGDETAAARTYDPATKVVTTHAPPAVASAPGATPGAPRFTASLAVDRTLRSTFRSRGLRVRLRCSAACSVTIVLRTDARTARALRRSRTVRTLSVTRAAAGRGTVALRVPGALARRVAARRAAGLTLEARVRAGSARLVLRRGVALAGR